MVTGGTPVHPSDLLGVSSDALWDFDDNIVPGYQALSDAVHAEGGRILAQLAHSAGTVLINAPGRASWSSTGRVAGLTMIWRITAMTVTAISIASVTVFPLEPLKLR